MKEMFKLQVMIMDLEILRSLRRTESHLEELKLCKSQEEKERLKDRWAMEDSAEKIANAIEHSAIYSRKSFGFFGF